MTEGPSNILFASTVLAILLFGAERAEGQNLALNGSFEEYEVCPNTVGFQVGDRPMHWHSWLISPDYFNRCAGSLHDIDTLVDVPQNGMAFQEPYDGDGYVGVYAYNDQQDPYREYVGAPLLEPLIPGCTYHVRFRANAAFGGNYWIIDGGGGCTGLGVLFTMHANAWEGLTGPPFAFRNYAHVYSATAITDTANWTLVEGDLTADSAYAYIVLGNFFDDAHTTGVPISGAPYVVYYLIDGVEVVPVDPACHSTGIEGYEGKGRPRIITSDNGVLINWPGRIIQEAMLIDDQGRVLARMHGDATQYARSPKPLCAGTYFVRVRDDREQTVVKFVKVE